MSRCALVRMVVAALVCLLAAGAGLGGYVGALAGGAPTHVCTCATGGTHATCPVCNPRLREEARSGERAFDGVPCGDGGGAIAATADPGVLPAPALAQGAPFVHVGASLEGARRPETRSHRPPTPPPRSTAA